MRKEDKKLVKHITNPEKITQGDKEPVSDLDYDGIEFPVQKKDFSKIKKAIFVLMCLVMKMGGIFQFTFQIKNLKTQWICCL